MSETDLSAKPTELDLVDCTETLLVVEDEKMVRNFVCEAHAVYDYKAIEEINGVDGLRLAKVNNHIDLLLTDVIMPHRSRTIRSPYSRHCVFIERIIQWNYELHCG